MGVYVLTSHCNFKTYVNVPHVNIYHIESVLVHRRTTTYKFFKGRLILGYIYRYTPVATPLISRDWSSLVVTVSGHFCDAKPLRWRTGILEQKVEAPTTSQRMFKERQQKHERLLFLFIQIIHTPLERCCVHNAPSVVTNSSLPPGRCEA